MPADVFSSYSANGTLVVGEFYYAVGPTFTVAYPFTISLYLNGALDGGLPAVYFNYSVTAVNGTWHGSFDHVVFNATDPGGSGAPAAAPAFQVNGTGLGPSGLPNDFELVIVGNDDGDTTTFFLINGTMTLRYWASATSSYTTVPAAYDAGSDTGETSTGVMPIYRTPLLGGAPTVHLMVGPSFVQGLWNVSVATDGAREFVAKQSPDNAFLFVSPGNAFDQATAQWVPTVRLFGATHSVFYVPNAGSFELEWLLSDRVPANYSVTNLLPLANSSTPLTVGPLTVNTTLGGYTPLLAWGNAELAAISSGAGTVASPYILEHHAVGGLDPVFGQMNDFGFPVFAGVLLINTTASVDVLQPQLGVAYGAWQDPLLKFLGVPTTNELQVELWNVSDLVLLNSTDLSGWLPASLAAFPTGEVLVWNGTDDLVSRNTFQDQGVALALYGGKNNTVWGNTILASSVEPSFAYANNTTGILESESGDLIYNNYVAVPVPAVTPTLNAVSCQITCQPASYVDTWNVPKEAATASTTVQGIVLTGSILHTWYQGGNFWSNYGTAADPFGVLPYTNGGAITHGGDYVPLTVSTLYNVTFTETGLAAGLPWNETSDSVTTASTTTTLTIALPNGTYPYTIGPPAGYAGPGPANLTVNGTNLSIPITFDELFTWTVHASGLVTGWSWNLTIATDTLPAVPVANLNTTHHSWTADLVNGSYSYSVSTYGYHAAPAAGVVTIDGADAVLTIHFTLVPILTVTATGLGASTPWTVTVTQGPNSVQQTAVGDGSLVFTVLQINSGKFSWSVSATNYTATPASGTGTSSTPVTEGVAFLANTPSSSSGSGLSWEWIVIGILAALAAAGFGLFLVERRRGRAPPKALVAAPLAAAPAAAAVAPSPAPTGPAPWEESESDTERSPAYGRRP